MEAIGIAASFIAIGQALLAGRHVINLLQEIPKIGNELASLNNEASPKMRSSVFYYMALLATTVTNAEYVSHRSKVSELLWRQPARKE